MMSDDSYPRAIAGRLYRVGQAAADKHADPVAKVVACAHAAAGEAFALAHDTVVSFGPAETLRRLKEFCAAYPPPPIDDAIGEPRTPLTSGQFQGYTFRIGPDDSRHLRWDGTEESRPYMTMRYPIAAIGVSELGVTIHLVNRDILHLSAHRWMQDGDLRNPLNWQLQLIHAVNG